jgi:hypothetical protein
MTCFPRPKPKLKPNNKVGKLYRSEHKPSNTRVIADSRCILPDAPGQWRHLRSARDQVKGETKLRYLQVLGLAFGVIAGGTAAFADRLPLDCGRRSLADAVAEAHAREVIAFTGVCAGPIVVRANALTLIGVGTGRHRRRRA